MKERITSIESKKANDGPRRPEDVPLKRRDVKDKDDTISNNKDLKNALKIGS